jgi:hypothetical protein
MSGEGVDTAILSCVSGVGAFASFGDSSNPRNNSQKRVPEPRERCHRAFLIELRASEGTRLGVAASAERGRGGCFRYPHFRGTCHESVPTWRQRRVVGTVLAVPTAGSGSERVAICKGLLPLPI